MKTITMLLLLIMLFSTFAFSGEIYGSIKEGGKSIGQGVRVEIISPSNTTYDTETDKYGSYSIDVKETEELKCRLIVHYKQQCPEIIVFSYRRSIRYDLVLEKEDEKYILKRR